MQLGKGIDASAAEKLAAKVEQDLVEGEIVVLVCKCNNFKPLVDRILLTNQRLLAASVTDGKIKFSARHGEVVDAVAESSWTGATLSVTKADGTSTVFKSMDVTDAEAVRDKLNPSGMATQPRGISASDSGREVEDRETGMQGSGQPSAMAKVGTTLKKAYNDAQAASKQVAEENAANFGAIVKKGAFGLKTVEIYESGYVRVGLHLTKKSPFEKLKSIKFSLQVQDRSGLGHLWASGGLGSREKRVLLLTIATDKQIHTLSTEGEVGRSEDKVGLALEAAGNSVLADLNSTPAPPAVTAQSAPEPTAAEKLRQIADLHKEGVLSDEEFAAAKAKLLEQL